jgi:hypothetical protein
MTKPVNFRFLSTTDKTEILSMKPYNTMEKKELNKLNFCKDNKGRWICRNFLSHVFSV